MQNQVTKLNAYTNSQTIHQLWSAISHYPQSQGHSHYLITNKYFKKHFIFTKKHCKTMVLNTLSPINVLATITIAPTLIKWSEIGNGN